MRPMQPTINTNTQNRQFHNNQLQRPRPARPSTPTPTAPLTTRLSAHSRRPSPNAPQRTLPTIPSPQELTEPTTTSSSTQSRRSDSNPPQRALPTVPSPQEPMESTTASSSTQPKYSTTYPPQEFMEPTTASSSTQDKQFNAYPPQRTVPTHPPVQSTTKTTNQSKQYAKVLEFITTRMQPQTILVNNIFTDKFINFVKSQNLSDEETTAILEAAAILYMEPTGDNEIDEQILLSLKHSIKPISHPHQTIEPKKPLLQKQTNVKKPVIHNNQEKKYTQKRFITHDLIMLLDPEQTETLAGSARLVVQDALVGLYEQAAPIIMSSNILEIITTLRQVKNRGLKSPRFAF